MTENLNFQQTETQIDKEVKAKRKSFIILFLGIGLGGNCVNWIFAHALGWFIGELAFLTAALTVLGLYFLLFPKKFHAHYTGKLNTLLVIVLILSLLIGWANFYAFEHGLY